MFNGDMPATNIHYVAKATGTEAAMSATTITPMGDDAFRIDCSRCGEQVTYRFEAFTVIEAARHEAWCAKHKA